MKNLNERQDHFFREAKKQGYPARSVYKLKEIDQKFKLIKKGNFILDLGCAPGSWMMYISEKIGHRGKVFGVDIQDMKIKIKENMEFIREDSKKAIKNGMLKIKKFDVVVSDMAPKTTGIKLTDVVNSLELAEEAFKIAQKTLKIRGHFVVKIFESEDTIQFVNMLKKYFNTVKRYSPQATRKQSREFYVVCKDFNKL
ncbi:RlmE family RNA methyltransferase [bacterium]|nr:MAG: RlmE family RNA methyltransferase [bacterium]